MENIPVRVSGLHDASGRCGDDVHIVAGGWLLFLRLVDSRAAAMAGRVVSEAGNI